MTELLKTPEVMDSNWFREGSLELLREQLAAQAYPGYPPQHERLWTEDDIWYEPLQLPYGPWDTSEGAVPTIPERAELAAKGLHLDAYGRPLHPWLEEMLTNPAIGIVTGKGFYWKWGPNYTADPIVVRRDFGEPHVLLIERADKTGWALPGGFVDGDETGLEAAIREAREETGVDLQAYAPSVTVTYTGPLADLRVTANAWPETTAVRFDIPDTEAAKLPNGTWKGSDDALTAGWFPISELNTKLFGSHVLLIKQALNQAYTK